MARRIVAGRTRVAGGLAHRAERVLYDVGAGERAPEFVRQAEADDGEDLVQPLQDAARDARFLMLQTPDQVAQEPLGLVCRLRKSRSALFASSWSQA